jgi:PAS domain S-box-containing protein
MLRDDGPFRAVFEGALDAMLIADDSGRYVDGNPAALALLGLDRDGLRKLRVPDLSKFPPGVDFDAVWKAFLASGRSEGEIMLLRADGQLVVAEFRAKAHIAEGRHLSVLRDVTHLRRMGELEERMQLSEQLASIGLLAASVIHEVKNPVTAVMGYLELMHGELEACLERGQAVDARDLCLQVEHALEASNQVAEIVRDVRLLSRAEDGITQSVDVHRVLESTLRMAHGELRRRVTVARDYGVIPQVRGSGSRLSQLFLNLIVNAAHAMSEHDSPRSNRLELKSWYDEPRHSVIVEIRDTGRGMTPEVLAQVFTPFFTTKPSSLGTGLGLAIARSIATDLGGDISVSSEPGRGSVFRVSLPAAAREPAAPVE